MTLLLKSSICARRYTRVVNFSLAIIACLISTPANAYFYASENEPPEFKHWKITQKAGEEAFYNNEYAKAEKILKAATEEARNIGPGDVRIAKSPGDLGRLLTVRGRFKEAQQYLEEEFYFKNRAIGEDVGKLVLDMEELIRFYLTCGTADKAKPLTQDLLDFVQGKFQEQTEQEAKASLEQGKTLIGWAGTAAPAVQDPLLDWAISCDKLGDLYRDRGDLAMADKLYKTALDVKATILGKKHLSLANSYDNLGGLYLKKNDAKEAESYFREALDITERVTEPGNPSVYKRMDRLASSLIAQGKISDAEHIYLTAIRRWQGSVTGNVEQRALFSLGCLYSDQRRFGSAAPVLRRALHIAEKMNGSQSVALVPYLRKYGYVLYYCGARGEGQNVTARANYISPIVKELQAQEAKISTGALTTGALTGALPTGKVAPGKTSAGKPASAKPTATGKLTTGKITTATEAFKDPNRRLK